MALSGYEVAGIVMGVSIGLFCLALCVTQSDCLACMDCISRLRRRRRDDIEANRGLRRVPPGFHAVELGPVPTPSVTSLPNYIQSQYDSVVPAPQGAALPPPPWSPPAVEAPPRPNDPEATHPQRT